MPERGPEAIQTAILRVSAGILSDGVQKFLGRPFVGAEAPSGRSLSCAMTVHQPVARFHLSGSALLLLTLALLPGKADAEDCVAAAAPKTATAAAKPRPAVRPPVRRPPPPTEAGALAIPKAQPAAQAKSQSPTRPRAVIQRKRPPATAKLAASGQAPKPVAKAVPTCTPVADPSDVRSRMGDVSRFTPIDPSKRLLIEPSVRQDPLEGIRTGLPGVDPMPPSLDLTPPGEVALVPPVQMALVPPFPVVLLPPPMGGGGGGGGGGVGPQLPVVGKPAPPLNPNPPVAIIPPLVVVPPLIDKPVDPWTPPDPDGPHPVPAPGSVWLLLAGLPGLLRQRCRAMPRVQR